VALVVLFIRALLLVSVALVEIMALVALAAYMAEVLVVVIIPAVEAQSELSIPATLVHSHQLVQGIYK
jgi:hypothetical protein